MMKLHPNERVVAFTEAGLWGADPWPALLANHVRTTPDRVAVVDPLNLGDINGSAPQRLTWAELSTRVDSVASVLLEHGIGEGDVVGVQLPNSVDLVTSYLALACLGAIATPFPVQYREHELVQMGRLAGIKAFMSVGQIFEYRPLTWIANVMQKLPGLDAVLAFGQDLPGWVINIDGGVDEHEGIEILDAHREALDQDPNNAVTICWTSGTESTPKGIPRCPNDWFPMALSSIDAMELTVDDVLLNPFPMVNMAGIGGMLVPWLLTGSTLIQHHPFDAATFFAQISGEKVTYTVAPPALLIRALDLPLCTPQVLESVRVIGSGSAPLPPSMITAWRDRFGIDIVNCFGSNEGVNLAGDPRTVPDPVQRAVLFPRFGSPDHTWPNRTSEGMRSKLIDPSDGTQVTEPNVSGELCLIGPGIFAGYLEGTGTNDPFDEEGYFHTGDLFHYVADASGDMRFLQYVDRAGDLIVRGGMNISPVEIESLVVMHPKIVDVAVIGLPDPALGERTRAVVTLKNGEVLTLEELLDFLRESNIATYKLPESLVVVDELPRNPVGKVLKRELRDAARAEPPQGALRTAITRNDS